MKEKEKFNWYIISVRGGKEKIIIEKIILELKKKEIKDKVKKLIILGNEKNFLGGYIACFCQMDQELLNIFYNMEKNMIYSFLNHKKNDINLPNFVSSKSIESIENLINFKENQKKNENLSFSSIRINDLVRINDGPFLNYEGKVISLNLIKEKVKLDIDFAGRITSIDLPLKNCEKVF